MARKRPRKKRDRVKKRRNRARRPRRLEKHRSTKRVPDPGQQRGPPELPTFERRLNFLSDVLVYLVLFFSLFNAVFNYERTIKNFVGMPLWLYALINGAIVALGFPRGFAGGFKRGIRHFHLPTPHFLSTIERIGASTGFVSVILSAVLMVYLSGTVASLLEILRLYVFPGLSTVANKVLANIGGWILAGIVGNLAYDVLKRIVAWRLKAKDGGNKRQTQ